MVTDFPIQGILDHLVERIVEVLPVTAAGVTLISAGTAPRYIAASDESALRFERLQSDTGEGPCLSAYESGVAVAIPDLASDERYPGFAPAAVEAGLAAVFTFPLRHGDGRLGALDLYRDVAGVLSPDDMEAAQTLADVAAAYLLNAQSRDEALATSDRFHHNAEHDPLTGLPNRTLLEDRLEHAAQRARRSNTNAAVLFADLDRFKEVNDTYGHPLGDELLLAVADRLSSLVRPGDTLARVSGDEFVFLCEDLHGPGDVEILAHRIDAAFALPFILSTGALSISASVGVAFSGSASDISSHLVNEADTAMYQTKRKGGAGHQTLDIRDHRTGDPAERLTARRMPFQDVLTDIAYLPIVRTADGIIVRVETLLRGSTRPLHIPHADRLRDDTEQRKPTSDSEEWVLERSCRHRVDWLREQPDAPLELAVHVSARQLARRDFSESVTRVLDRTGMDPTGLVLQITESTLGEQAQRSVTALSGLRAMGIRIALDDFGSGYSSLRHLLRLPIHIVKIDKAFVADIGQPSRSRTILESVTHLAHELGLTVVADGVHTQQQLRAVTAAGCDQAQGLLFGQPLMPDEVRARTTPPEQVLSLPAPRATWGREHDRGARSTQTNPDQAAGD